MSEEPGINLESDHLEALIQAAPETAPVVVIQYRSRGLPAYIAIPMLILAALGSVAVYHRLAMRTPQTQPLAPTLRGPTPARPVPSPPPLPTPLALNSQPFPGDRVLSPGVLAASPSTEPGSVRPEPPDTARPSAPHSGPEPRGNSEPVGPPRLPPVADLGETGPSAPADPPPPPPPVPQPIVAAAPGGAALADDRPRPPLGGAVAVGFTVPSDPDNPFSDLAIARKPPAPHAAEHPDPSPAAAARRDEPEPRTDPPLPDRSELMADIAREAESKQAELQQQREMKERAREVVDAESQKRLEEDRVAFRRELAEILRNGGKEAGQQIDSLCNRYGRNYDPMLRARVTYLLRHSNGRVSREARVRQFRAFGVPEPGILDYLANEMHHLINTRNGPRHPDDVRVSAARQLLRMKLSRDEDTGSTELQARSVTP